MASGLARHILLNEGDGEDFLEAIGRVSSSDLRAGGGHVFQQGGQRRCRDRAEENRLRREPGAAGAGPPPCCVSSSSPGGLFPAAPAEPPGGTAVRLVTEAGLTWIFRKDTSSALTCLLLLIRGGTGADPAGKAGLAYLTTRSAIDIPDEGKVRDIMVQSTRLTVAGLEDATLVSVQCLSENLEDALKTVTRILKDPLLSGLRIDIIKENMRHQGKTELDDSVRAGRAEAKRAFFGPEGYGGPVWGTDETLKAIRKKDVADFYKSRFTLSNMLLSVSSDLEEAAVARLVGKYFSGFPSGPRPGGSYRPRRGSRRSAASSGSRTRSRPISVFISRCRPRARGPMLWPVLAEDMLGGGVGSALWPLRSRDQLAYTVDSSIFHCRRRGRALGLPGDVPRRSSSGPGNRSRGWSVSSRRGP